MSDSKLRERQRHLRERPAQNREKLRFLNHLAGRGLKLTRQREAVLDEILASSEHFEADDIVLRLRQREVRVSRATVYRTLEMLQECQLVERLDFGTSPIYYEHTQLGAHHDHLICVVCRQVIEFYDSSLERRQGEICQQHRFKETHHSLRIFGICENCA